MGDDAAEIVPEPEASPYVVVVEDGVVHRIDIGALLTDLGYGADIVARIGAALAQALAADEAAASAARVLRGENGTNFVLATGAGLATAPADARAPVLLKSIRLDDLRQAIKTAFVTATPS